ncbi:hypothetical protein PR048_017835 [Dryococelus australis]|uniref:Uncharacterized protein n=1 Tax=Dryococelus australis TaxID=614101 RepID=A0ABQ9HAP9_9NEOP|nr:hypothetical protein PR048_017835 [Dryococelus australis]
MMYRSVSVPIITYGIAVWYRILTKVVIKAQKEALLTITRAYRERWDTYTKGRWTYSILLEVADRVKLKWLDIGYHPTQFLTRHCNFKA